MITKFACWTLVLLGLGCIVGSSTLAAPPLEPFQPDEQTLLLYHFDEGQGTVAKDASRYGYDGEVRGAQWTEGRFGKALHFDGVDDCVFRKVTSAIEGLKQITVECWFKQENPDGRQFLLGKDVTFHFDFSEGMGTSLSLYHRGGTEANADGLRHQQLGLGLGSVRSGRWHHLAATFDGQRVSFFLDGVLRGRQAGARDFLLGVDSRGIWVGCYVGDDFWFSGKIDEVRVSNCLRYDPEGTLQVGQKAVEFPPPPQRQRDVRTPQTTGKAQLRLTLKKLYGPNAAGWVSLKSPGATAVIVGRFDLANVADQGESQLAWDVSDELAGDGCYIVGLEETGGGGYFAVTAATLAAGDRTLARWSGQAASRRTFAPPVLVPLQVHAEQGGDSAQDGPRRPRLRHPQARPAASCCCPSPSTAGPAIWSLAAKRLTIRPACSAKGWPSTGWRCQANRRIACTSATLRRSPGRVIWSSMEPTSIRSTWRRGTGRAAPHRARRFGSIKVR